VGQVVCSCKKPREDDKHNLSVYGSGKFRMGRDRSRIIRNHATNNIKGLESAIVEWWLGKT